MVRKCMGCERILNKRSFGKNQLRKEKTLIRCKDCTSRSSSPPRKKLKSGIPESLNNNASTMVDSNGKNIAVGDKKFGELPSSNSNTKSRKIKDKKKKEPKKKEVDPEFVKAKLKERINVLSDSERQIFQLEWASFAISESDEKAIADKFVKGWYGPMDGQEIEQMRDHIKSTQMTIWQVISLRSACLQQKGMYRHQILKKQAKNAYNQYKKGMNVLDLAKELDQPPMNVFRIILSQMKWSKAQIKRTLRDPHKFEARERKEFLAAESSDIVSMVNQVEIHKNAEIFEDVLSAWLKGKKIRFVRQKQLEKEQKKEFGTAVLTPDFLLLDSVLINGVPCHWIDCKAFYGANLQFTIKKTNKQMKRYIDHWGSGAIVYLQGFSEKIKINNCALLNAYGALDVKILSKLEEKNCTQLNRVTTTVF